MEQAQVLLQGLWEPFSFFALFGYACLGILLGASIALVVVVQLQRRGWLARRKPWHHWLLKLYFLLLPLGGAFLGAQGGLLYGAQQQVNRHLDSYAPVVQEVASGVWIEFERYWEAQDQRALGRQLQQMSVQEVLSQVVSAYLQEQFVALAHERAGASLAERVSLKLFAKLQHSLLTAMVRDVAVDQVAQHSMVKPEVVVEVLEAQVAELFQADFLLGLLKQQIGQTLKPFYLTLLFVGLLGLAMVAAELWLSRYWRQWPAPLVDESVPLAPSLSL